MSTWYLGIDLGGTKTFLGQVEEKGEIGRNLTFPTEPKRGYQATLDALIGKCREFILSCKSEPQSVGIGVAGQVDAKTGMVSFAPNLFWKNVPFKSDLEKALSLPVTVLNDVQAATWGEAYFFHKETSSLLGIFIGTGIGGGFIYRNKLLLGSSGSFGEVGHMAILPNGPLCLCGRPGCLEAIAGGHGLEREAKRRASEAPILLSLVKQDPSQITTSLLFEAYKKKDPLAIELIDRAVCCLSSALATLINLLNPEVIVLGGGAMRGYLPFFQKIEERAKAMALPMPAKKVEITLAKIAQNSAAIGAAVYKNQI